VTARGPARATPPLCHGFFRDVAAFGDLPLLVVRGFEDRGGDQPQHAGCSYRSGGGGSASAISGAAGAESLLRDLGTEGLKGGLVAPAPTARPSALCRK